MKKYFVIVIFMQTPFIRVLSQNIDSLKKILTTANDTYRVDCLNALGKIYQYTQTDSALFYSYGALSEAKDKQYIRGVAEAFLNLANSYAQRGDYRSAEQNFRLSISNYEKVPDTDALGWAYLWLGVSLYAQSNFQSATQTFIKAEELFKKVNDIQGANQILFFLAFNYEESGFYENAFELCAKSLGEARKNNDQQFYFYSLLSMGRLYQDVEDYQTALDYYQQASSFADSVRLASQICTFCSMAMTANLYIGEIYYSKEKFDSSVVYLNRVLAFYKTSPKDSHAIKESMMAVTESFGELYLRQKDYNKALTNFFEPMKFYMWGNNGTQLMRVLLNIGRAYAGKGAYTTALDYARRLLLIAKKAGARKYIRDGTGLLWNIYDKKGMVDSAYYYYQRYANMKDSLLDARYIRQVALFKEKSKNDKEQLQMELALQKESLSKKIVIGILVIIVLLAFTIIRIIMLKRKNEKNRLENRLQLQELKNEKTIIEFKQLTTELEMQVLRAQMNPHFIFNSLNSINRFILQNNRAQASEYLTKFSKLVRMILQNSQASLITLESELESLDLYLNLESLRFNYHFDYNITVPKDIDKEVLQVPPLILQPYVENAIWHGLMHKEEKGHLDIDISEKGDHLFLKIKDNGVGREKAKAMSSKSATKHKSMGLRITENRIAILQKNGLQESPVTIHDLVNDDGTPAGTEVIIKMPLIYD